MWYYLLPNPHVGLPRSRRRLVPWYVPATKARISSKATLTRSSHVGAAYTSCITRAPRHVPDREAWQPPCRRRSSIRSSVFTAMVGIVDGTAARLICGPAARHTRFREVAVTLPERGLDTQTVPRQTHQTTGSRNRSSSPNSCRYFSRAPWRGGEPIPRDTYPNTSCLRLFGDRSRPPIAFDECATFSWPP